MSGTEETFHYTKEDIRKLESRESKLHGGSVPKDADSSHFKSIVDSKSNADIIAERQANLPLPEQPPVASDWNSADGRTVNVGSGGISEDISYGKGSDGLRGPATGESSVRVDGDQYGKNTAPDSGVGRQGKDGLDGPPKDARAK
ncbi:MAG: hypothetical protein M1830_001456 [Pleopsidium flavum]|nr:MAG: hypothetical protein M1830_001456 [Pleopsidium flavum]